MKKLERRSHGKAGKKRRLQKKQRGGAVNREERKRSQQSQNKWGIFVKRPRGQREERTGQTRPKPKSSPNQGPISQAQSELDPEIFKAHFVYAPATSKDGFD
jgi:hypothetical protein